MRKKISFCDWVKLSVGNLIVKHRWFNGVSALPFQNRARYFLSYIMNWAGYSWFKYSGSMCIRIFSLCRRKKMSFVMLSVQPYLSPLSYSISPSPSALNQNMLNISFDLRAYLLSIPLYSLAHTFYGWIFDDSGYYIDRMLHTVSDCRGVENAATEIFV